MGIHRAALYLNLKLHFKAQDRILHIKVSALCSRLFWNNRINGALQTFSLQMKPEYVKTRLYYAVHYIYSDVIRLSATVETRRRPRFLAA